VSVDGEVASPGVPPYSIDTIRSFETSHRTAHSSGSQIAVYVLFVDGGSTSDNSNGKVLGEAYQNTSIVIYESSIKGLSGGLTQPSHAKLETTVLTHEFGHLLGLVNTGTNMVTSHQDTANGKHCSNQNCLMYWNVDTSNVIANLTNSGIPDLDSDCQNDLKTNGGK